MSGIRTCRPVTALTRTNALILTLCMTAAVCAAQSPARKNVLFIAIDDLRPALGCYGDKLAITPHIDRLAAEGMVFDKAYCQQAVCAPSRTSLMTGLRPDKAKVWGLNTLFRNTVPEVITLPEFFKKQGYRTDAVGKIYHDPRSHQDPPSWSGKTVLTITQNGTGNKYVLPENLTSKKGASTERQPVADSAYIDGKVTDAALQLLHKVKDRPFFLAVGFRRPHLPFTAPDRYWRMYDTVNFKLPVSSGPPVNAPAIAFHDSQELRGYNDIPNSGPLPPETMRKLRHGYYAAVSYIDFQVGRLLDELERLNLKDNTIVVLWSDHGYHLGEQGLWCKSTNFENAVRVPLIISTPGMKTKGTHTKALVELVDVYPTLVDLCGFSIPGDLDGKSLKPVLDNPAVTVKSFALSQFVRPYDALFNDADIKVMGYSLRVEDYRYTEWRTFGTDSVIATELYDHRNDPEETVNIAGSVGKKKLRGFRNALEAVREKGVRSKE